MTTLSEQQERPLYIGFGSMEELGFFSSLDSVEIIGIINEGLILSFCPLVLPATDLHSCYSIQISDSASVIEIHGNLSQPYFQISIVRNSECPLY